MQESYSLKREEKKVTLDDKVYTVKEADEDASAEYRNASTRGTTMRDGVVSMGKIGDIQKTLVGACVFDSNDVPVGIAVVGKWPARVVRDMFDWIKEVSNLAEGREGQSKNSPNGTAVTST